jgi:mRNA-degrading endonuclease RelE of RelBE toxin-antitoxin system
MTLELEFTKTFRDGYRQLPDHIKDKTDKALKFLAHDVRHPGLQTKPVQGAKGIYEARVDRSYRMTYERVSGGVLRMRVVGKHDDVLNNP